MNKNNELFFIHTLYLTKKVHILYYDIIKYLVIFPVTPNAKENKTNLIEFNNYGICLALP